MSFVTFDEVTRQGDFQIELQEVLRNIDIKLESERSIKVSSVTAVYTLPNT